MPIEIPETLKEYAGIFGKGFVAHMAPKIGKGVLVRILKDEKVDRKKATEWVQSNTRLWDVLKPEYGERLKLLGQTAGGIDWLTAEWFIEAIRHDLPAVASLFLGWRKARNWLTRQVEIIRKEVSEAN